MSHKIFRTFFGIVFVLAQFLTGVTPALAAAPANDNFANAEAIGSLPFSATVDNTEATAEAGEVTNCGSVFRSLWYSFTPSEDMAIQVGLSSAIGASLSISQGTGPEISDLTFLACVFSGNNTNIQVQAGNTYYLRVDTFGQPGSMQIDVQQITPPANDNFANAEAINSLPFSATIDNSQATAEADEAFVNNCGVPFRSVWYSFSPAEDMAVQLDMNNSAVGGSVTISLASGPGISGLTTLACAFIGAPANVALQAGSTYYLRVDSAGQAGTLQFNLQQITPPENDDFANAEAIGSLPFSATIDNTDATTEPDEPQACAFPNRSVWYSFTPAENMAVQVDMVGSAVSGAVSIFLAAGPTLSDLHFLSCAYSNSTNIWVEGGKTYYLRVDTFGQAGSLQLNLHQITPPANDSLANAEVIASLPFTATADNTNASLEAGEPVSCSGAFRTVWYSLTPTEDMTLRIDMLNGPVSGCVTVYAASGPAFSDLTAVAGAYSGGSNNFQVQAGKTYYIQVDSQGQAGSLQFNLQQITPPANDNFASAEAITSLPFSATVDNTNASAEPSEPSSCGFASKTVWYSFTPDVDMAVQAGLSAGPSSQAIMNVFVASGPDISDLTHLRCIFSGNSANISVEAGKTYYLQVDGVFGQAGTFQVNLGQITPPANDNFIYAQAITSLPFNAPVDNTNASVEPGEPQNCTFPFRSLWYSFTPTENALVQLSVVAGSGSGYVSIYQASGPTISDLTFLGCASSFGSANINAEAGKTYYLQVDSSGQPLSFEVNLQQITPPSNDNFANAATITTLPFSITADNTNASLEPGEPFGCGFPFRSLWYTFSPAETTEVRISALGSTGSGNVTLYAASGSTFADLTSLACAGGFSTATALVEAGKTYYLRLDSFGGQAGLIQANLQLVVPLTNDNFANAQAITSLPFSASVDLTDATTEANERQVCSFSQNTIWYSFTATETARIKINMQGSASSTFYRDDGGGLSGLQFLQCAGNESLVLVEAGQTYYFQVAASGQPGLIQFNLAEVPSITGRVTDASTGSPLPGNIEPYTTVHLYRECGDGCLEFVNSQNADSEGHFIFDSYYYGIPLPVGSYRIRATAYLYAEKEFGPFEFSGSNLNVGDLPLEPPAVIRGRAVDSATGSPLVGASVTLRRCDTSGCFEYVNSQGTDSDGHFQFNSFYYGLPLAGGDYELEISASLHDVRRIQVTISDGENRDLGDVLIDPTPLIGSISGRLLDVVTGAPIDPVFVPQLYLYRCDSNGCNYVNSMAPDAAGRFRFETDASGNHLIVGTYYIYYSADQYFSNQTDTFAVGENMNRALGDIKITSFPVRFTNVVTCGAIPATGGDCDFSVKVWNGLSRDLSGKAWSMANSDLPYAFIVTTHFQVREAQDLGIAKGKAKVFRFRLSVPANNSQYGANLCAAIFIGEGNQALFNTIGFRNLFCVFRIPTGYSIRSPQEVTSQIQANAVLQNGTEVEPNNSCLGAQDVGALSGPFVMSGHLDSSTAPDIDFFRFSGPAGSPITIDLRGVDTDLGRLSDPYLGVFDSNCNLLYVNDDSNGSLNSHLDVNIPADGNFVVAATTCCDGGFTGGGSGSYELALAPVTTIGSVSGIITDAVSGNPLRGDVAPYAFVRLLRCDFFCDDVNSQNTGSDGSFRFETDSSGNPLRTGQYMVIASADQYQPVQTSQFSVGESEDYDSGRLALTSYPIRFSDLQSCSLPAAGGICDFSVKITNGLATRFSGKAWTIIESYGIGSFVDFTHFQTDSPLDVSLAPGRSMVLRFRFQVRGSVADGAVICATTFVGQNPDALFNTAGLRSLFCFVKQSNGFSLMSEQQMQTQMHQMQIREAVPINPPSRRK